MSRQCGQYVRPKKTGDERNASTEATFLPVDIACPVVGQRIIMVTMFTSLWKRMISKRNEDVTEGSGAYCGTFRRKSAREDMRARLHEFLRIVQNVLGILCHHFKAPSAPFLTHGHCVRN